MVEYQIDIPEELTRLNLAANYIRARNRHLPAAMEKSVAAGRAAVAGDVPVGVTGAAQRSIGSRVVVSPFQVVGKVESSLRRPNIYIYVLNSGRRPGKRMASSTELEPWVQHKGLASDPLSVRRIAFLIARAVQKKGTAGRSFFYRALQRTKGMIDAYHRAAVEAITRELEHGG